MPAQRGDAAPSAGVAAPGVVAAAASAVATGVPAPRGDCACAFPFTYKDRTYTQCTQVDETTPWCALETEGDGTFDPHRNDWAFCTGPAEC